ncbi:MAG: integrase/recombinase XerD [Petrotoga sp.]|nr:integrase/recombinase XerD [Petrotoga sp.]
MKEIVTKASNLPTFSSSSYGEIKHLTEDELNRLTEEFLKWYETKPNAKRARYLLLFLFLRFTGARISEIISIDETRDIDFRRSEIRIKNLKKHKHKNSYRIVPVPDKLIAEYLRLCHIHPQIQNKALKVARTNFFTTFRKICKQAGIPEDLAHPHILRHTRAIELIRAGVPITAVKSILGHSNLNTTAIYLQYSAVEIKEILKIKGLV